MQTELIVYTSNSTVNQNILLQPDFFDIHIPSNYVSVYCFRILKADPRIFCNKLSIY